MSDVESKSGGAFTIATTAAGPTATIAAPAAPGSTTSASVGSSSADASSSPGQVSPMRATLVLTPRNQAPISSVILRSAASTSTAAVAGATDGRTGGSGAATPRRTRSRRRRDSVRFQNSAQPSTSADATILPLYHAGDGASTILSRRRRSSQRESAIADARLARRFPSVFVRVLAALHFTICFLVLFVQFWTSSRVHAASRVDAAFHWVRTVLTYGYMCALLSGLAGCSGIALYLQQSKIRAISFLGMSVSTAFICCYLLSFYTTYFAEIRMFVSAQGCIEKYNKHPSFQVPFELMTILTLLEFFIAFVSIVLVSTIINRARACWWSCDPCNICHLHLDDDVENSIVVVDETNLDEMPPSYFDHPPPYKP